MKLNMMKSKCYNYLRDLIKIFKEKIINESIIKILSCVVDVCIFNLEFIITEKFRNISKMSRDKKEFPDYNYELVIYSC